MRRVRTALTTLAVLAPLAACSTTSVEQPVVEERVGEHVVEEFGVVPDDVTCPDAIRADVGNTMTCLIGFEGQEYDVEVEVTDEADQPEDVGLRFQVIDFLDD